MSRGGRHRAEEVPAPRPPSPAGVTPAGSASADPGEYPFGDHHSAAPDGSTDLGSRVLSEMQLSRRIPRFNAGAAPNTPAPGRV
jgi:hypothetical protein